jgi:hypothetical protein
MQTILLSAAKALDENVPHRALAWLRELPLTAGDDATRLVALALWKRMVLISNRAGPLDCRDSGAAVAALSDLGAALTGQRSIWVGYRAFSQLEKLIGSADAAAAVASIFWDRVLTSHEGVFVAAFSLFFRGGDIDRCRDAWFQFLAARKDHIPGYWNFLYYCKMVPSGNRADMQVNVERMLATTGRQDLAPLIAFYLLQMRQENCKTISDAALKLEDPAHRNRAAELMTGLGYMPEDLPVVVAAHRELASGPKPNDAALGFMEARLANAEGRWEDVLALAKRSAATVQHHQAGELLAANALGQLGQYHEARQKLAAVANAPDTPDYLRARAAFIRVTVERTAKGLPVPERMSVPEFKETPGRPLAQSLWVGKRLRWIERLAIQSYLDNGWRFQLYAYDDVENTPEGCELLDANAIIPRKDVFREGFGSGLHAGSVGAFSDLFRYRLLYERGGMWTDTDVINIRRFDPDGQKFISTEITDAGLITMNGAIMAAPAGHALMGRAYERACELIKAESVFFTRIGPYLLAELLVEAGVHTMSLMPPNFLSAVFWMSTGNLLQPYDDFMRRLQEKDIVNLHVYTEMWRMLGLGLEKPPGAETFIGRLYREHFAGKPSETVGAGS